MNRIPIFLSAFPRGEGCQAVAEETVLRRAGHCLEGNPGVESRTPGFWRWLG